MKAQSVRADTDLEPGSLSESFLLEYSVCIDHCRLERPVMFDFEACPQFPPNQQT